MVKLVEMGFNPDGNNGMDFDVCDDIVVYMRNDPEFYRKHYYPTLAKMCDAYRKDNKIQKESLKTLVSTAIPMYMKKFKIDRKPSDVFTNEDCQNIAEMIFDEEAEEIRNGEY